METPEIQRLEDGTTFESDPIQDDDPVWPGDKFVFITRRPDLYKEIHMKVVTVADVSLTGGIHPEEFDATFVRRCFHRIVHNVNGEAVCCAFDDVFA